jgi:hypothetical protein
VDTSNILQNAFASKRTSTPAGSFYDCRITNESSSADGNVLSEYVVLHPQQFAERPRLKGAAAWRVRRLGVGDLGDVGEAGFAQMLQQQFNEAAMGMALCFVGVAAQIVERNSFRSA